VRALVLLLALAGLAHADRKAAERYFRAGEKAYRAQSFEAAATSFDRAYEELPLPEIAFSSAQAHRRAYRIASDRDAAIAHATQAVAMYKVYLDKVKKGGRVADAIDSLREMERELERIGALKPAAPGAPAPAPPPPPPKHTRLGVLVVFADQTASSALKEISDEPSAAMQRVATFIDAKPVPPDELVDVEPGEHIVRAESEGYMPKERKVKVVKDSEPFETLELEPAPARVTVVTDDDAAISVDGRAAGSVAEVAAGKHVITVTRRGRQPVAREIVVTRGQQITMHVELEMTLKRRAVPWVIGGAAGLALVSITGIVPWLVFDNQARDLGKQLQVGDQEPSVGEDYNNALARRDGVATGMWISGGAAVVVAGVGAALYFFDTPSPEGVRLTPVVTSSGAGAVISGRF